MADQDTNAGEISSAGESCKPRLLTRAERKKQDVQTEQAKEQLMELEREKERRQDSVALAANLQWEWADPADHGHMFLIANNIRPHNMRRIADRLLLPLYRYGELVNLVYVRPDGIMSLMAGGRRSGTYILFGQAQEDQPIYLCEKWTTGARLHQETRAAVACSLFAGNLLLAARSIEQQYPYHKLILVQEATCSKEVRAEFKHARAELARSTILDLGEVDHG